MVKLWSKRENKMEDGERVRERERNSERERERRGERKTETEASLNDKICIKKENKMERG